MKSRWSLYGVWWALGVVRQMDLRLQERDQRIESLETDLLEWQNKTLSLANLRPLHHKPGPLPEPIQRAPIGPTMKAGMQAQRAAEIDQKTRPSDEEILQAANKVSSNGNK